MMVCPAPLRSWNTSPDRVDDSVAAMIERSVFLRAVVFAAITFTSPVRADLLIGDFSDNDTASAHPILRFPGSANGNVAPSGSFLTDLPGERLQTPFYLTYEPVENVVYVADFYGQAIRVYAEDANGNTAPLRSFSAPLLGQPRQVAISTEHDELFAAVSGCCLAAFPRTASGSNVAALRFIQWGGSNGSLTRLNNPTGPALRKSSDTLIVADYKQNPDNTYSGVLLSFDRTASGNAAPVSSIEGNLTGLGNGAVGPAYDAVHDEIIVVGVDYTTSTYRILSFAGDASGNVQPLRSIEGPTANLNLVNGIAYDPVGDLIYVAQGGYNGVPATVQAFPRSAHGDVAPLRTIAGGNTLVGYPLGITITTAHIFKDGFE